MGAKATKRNELVSEAITHQRENINPKTWHREEFEREKERGKLTQWTKVKRT